MNNCQNEEKADSTEIKIRGEVIVQKHAQIFDFEQTQRKGNITTASKNNVR